MNLADSRIDCLRGCLATLSVLVVRIALLEYSKIHEKAYKFGGFQNVLRDACVRAIPTCSDIIIELSAIYPNCDYTKQF